MKMYKQKFIEMANLGKEDTGLSHGTIYISVQNSSHSARVKYYRTSPKKDAPNAVITISKNPEIIHDDIKLTIKEKEEIIKFVSINYRKLLTFWIRGDEMISSKFIASLRKIK